MKEKKIRKFKYPDSSGTNTEGIRNDSLTCYTLMEIQSQIRLLAKKINEIIDKLSQLEEKK